jgi:hypothetical protein
LGSSGTVRLSDLWAMLDVCLPGYTKKATDHHWRVTCGTRTFPALPLGEHGKRQNPPIQVGHARKLVRFFDIMTCARQHLEILD